MFKILIVSNYVLKGPDDELFPAQEALLHIQTRIVDLILDKDNTITTKLILIRILSIPCIGESF